MATHKVKQGDSLWIDYECTDLLAIDPVWANWTGKWSITKSLGSTILLSGTLTRTATESVFALRIGPSNDPTWKDLAAGDYLLNTQFDSSIADFRFEDTDRVRISTQAITL